MHNRRQYQGRTNNYGNSATAAALLVCACVAAATGVVGAQSALPACLENGTTLSVLTGSLYAGVLTPPVANCSDSNGFVGGVIADGGAAQGATLGFTTNNNYLFSPSPTANVLVYTLGVTCAGAMVCNAVVTFNVVQPTTTTAAPPTTTTTTAAPPTTTVPLCGATVVTIVPSTSYSGILSAAGQACSSSALTGKILSQPPAGAGAAIVTSGLGYLFAAPSTNVVTSFSYAVYCGATAVCQDTQTVSVYLPTPVPTPAPPVQRCPQDKVLYTTPPGIQISATLAPGVNCSSPSGVVTSLPPTANMVFTSGLRFLFVPPTTEADVVVQVNVLCSGAVVCASTLGFIVTSLTPAPTPAPPTPMPTAAPTPAPPTPVPTTPAPPIPACGVSFAYNVPSGTQLLSNLTVPFTTTCTVETYVASPIPANKGQFLVNILGSFLYTASTTQGTDFLAVDVYCYGALMCRSPVNFTVFTIITPMPTPAPTIPTPAPTPVPIGACANVYYYYVNPGGVLSNSLRGMPGENACAYGRSFSLVRNVQSGILVLTALGDFTYQAPAISTFFDFGFQMSCMGQVVCLGSAYLQVTAALTPNPTQVQTLSPAPGATTPSPTPAPPIVLPNAQMTCRGTCSDKTWKTAPNKNYWDDTPGLGFARSDGRKVGSMDLAWVNGTLVVTVYTLIGNLGLRVPTLESFSSFPGSMFTSADIAGQVQLSSTSFQQSCLDQQSRYGLGEDVWKWVSLSNLTGTLGANYASGNTWYQKFGGKHANCDTFLKPCQYAPLLTPNALQSSAYAKWTVDVSDCDATWTGVFSLTALSSLRRVDGSKIWTYVASRQIQGTIYTQVLRATSWLDPSKGFDSRADASSVTLNLRQYVNVRKITPSSAFTFDYEYFEYQQDGTGDAAFGVNLLLYPFVPLGATTSYASDRHASGFKWLSQSWTSPSNVQCPTCTGSKTQCVVPQQYSPSTYYGPFSYGDCPPGSGRVLLSKGPSMAGTNCSATNPMNVLNRVGFSAPTNCSGTYQNLTIRGYAPGSTGLTTAQRNTFTWEGSVQIQLLMDNGDKPIISIDFSIFVSRVAKNLVNNAGELGLCRASTYYPVLDPFGRSTPDSPLPLSGVKPGYLCSSMLSRDFGPSGWMTMFLNLPGISPSQVSVSSIRMRYNNSNTVVYLYYTDPVTGAPTIPPAAVGQWWARTHPFLNFRSLTDRIANTSTIAVDPAIAATTTPLTTIAYAFAFTPGAISMDTEVEVSVFCTLSTTNADGSVSQNPNTFTRWFHTDPLLTAETRNGPSRRAPIPPAAVASSGYTSIFIVLAAAALIYALWFAGDNDKPLPVIFDKLLSLMFLFAPPPKPEGEQEVNKEEEMMKVILPDKYAESPAKRDSAATRE